MNLLASIVQDRHGELRIVWRMLLFLLVATATVLLFSVPLRMLEGEYGFLSRAVVLAGILAATLVMTRTVNHKPFRAVGLAIGRRMFRGVGMGALLGLLMMTGIFLVEYGLGDVSLSWRGLPLVEAISVGVIACATFGLGAMTEELFFRGYLFQTLIQGLTFLPAMLIVSFLFAMAHWGNPGSSTFGLINAGLAGVWLSFAYFKSRSLWLPFGLHFGWNFAQSTLFGLPVSGGYAAETRLWDSAVSGPEWVTGGSYGPEGGVLATIAMILCTGHILKSTMYTAPAGTITLDSLEDLVSPATQGMEKGQ